MRIRNGDYERPETRDLDGLHLTVGQPDSRVAGQSQGATAWIGRAVAIIFTRAAEL